MLFTFNGRSMLLKSLLTPDDFTTLSDIWLALLKGPIFPTDDGDSLNEVDAPSYTRVGIGAIKDYWQLTAHGAIANASAVYWPPATSVWGRVSGWALCTTPQGGEVIAGGDFLDSMLVGEMDVLSLAPGMLVLEIA